MKSYDVIIPAASKDYVKLRHCVDGLDNLIEKPSNVFIISKKRVNIPGTQWVSEEEAVGFYPERITCYRNTWIYQQLIKLCQNVTSDWYLSVDSDLILRKPIHVFKDDNPVFWSNSSPQRHMPYFVFMAKFFGMTSFHDSTFICDMMMFNRQVCQDIVKDKDKFIEMINGSVNKDCLLSEFELYGNYVKKHNSYPYSFANLNTTLYGRCSSLVYTYQELTDIINSDTVSDAIAIHSWN